MFDTIGKRIWIGFAVILVLLLAMGGISYYSIHRMGTLEEASKIAATEGIRLHDAKIKHLAWVNTVSDIFLRKDVDRLNVQTDDHQCTFGKWLYSEQADQMARIDPGIHSLLEKIKQPHRELHDSAKQIGSLFTKFDQKNDALLAERWIDHLTWANDLRDYLMTGKKFTGSLNPHQCAFGQWYYTYRTDDPELESLLKKWASPHEALHNSAQKIIEANESGDRSKAMLIYERETLPALDQLGLCYQETMRHIDNIIEKNNQAMQIFQNSTQKNTDLVLGYMDEIESILDKKEKTFQEQYSSFSSFVSKFIPITALLALIIGGLMAFLLSQNIVVPLRRIIATLSNGAQQVYTASEQISSSSQQLAEGASEQAASLEETSASLEEITSMTKNNADHAHQANQLMEETKGVVEQAGQSMKAMDQSMTELSTASEEIGKIIKTIDEIAFQTNLLALNAAVEAARAGEAGKGFAVVADEVRNLAQRAAEAARNTSGMIEDAVHKINDGSSLARRTFEAFARVESSAGKVADLVSEIAAASKEQAQGIDQVNVAISQMDKVTQQNAAGAAEGAASSEKLHLQSENLKAMVDDLTRLVGGDTIPSAREIILADETGPPRLRPPRIAGPTGPARGGMIERRTKIQAAPKEGRVVKPEEIIPLDDNDFTDFNG
ncbi:MAG: methyl-accepting chemotaxis protein [bacterium]